MRRPMTPRIQGTGNRTEDACLAPFAPVLLAVNLPVWRLLRICPRAARAGEYMLIDGCSGARGGCAAGPLGLRRPPAGVCRALPGSVYSLPDDTERASTAAAPCRLSQPPAAVPEAFGATAAAAAEPLDGGQGQTWRAGAVVLKPFDDQRRRRGGRHLRDTRRSGLLPRPIGAETGKAWSSVGWHGSTWRRSTRAEQRSWPRPSPPATRSSGLACVPRPAVRRRQTHAGPSTASRRRAPSARSSFSASPTAFTVSCGRSTCRRRSSRRFHGDMLFAEGPASRSRRLSPTSGLLSSPLR